MPNRANNPIPFSDRPHTDKAAGKRNATHKANQHGQEGLANTAGQPGNHAKPGGRNRPKTTSRHHDD